MRIIVTRVLAAIVGFMISIPSITAQVSCDAAIGAECGISYSGSTLGMVSDNVASGASACSVMLNTTGQHWYTFVSEESTLVMINTCGSSFDTFLNVYTGTCGALSCEASNDDSGNSCFGFPNGSGWNSYLTIAADAGITYYIRVGGFGSANGNYILNLGCSTQAGCTDVTACNYSAFSTTDDGSCEYDSCQGCTDYGANNYDPTATIDDGSCAYCSDNGGVSASLYVCTFGNGQNVELSIFNDQGELVLEVPALSNGAILYFDICLDPTQCYTAVMGNNTGPFGWYGGYFWVNANGAQITNQSLDANLETETVSFSTGAGCGPVLGCTDASACNYNAFATDEDGSCDFESCLGCTDFTANNYDPTATVDDGSCAYCSDNGGVATTLYVCTFSNGPQVELSFFDQEGNLVLEVPTLNNGEIMYLDLCLDPNQCYTAVMGNNTGPFGWYNGYFWINANGIQIVNQSLDANLATETVIFTINGDCGLAVGCTDELACNFDPLADVDSGNCVYAEDCNDLIGCTNSSAINYDPSAAMDDGSCEFGAGSTCGEAFSAECGMSYSGSTVEVPNDSSTSGAAQANCGGYATSGGQHWYSITPASSGTLTVSTCGSEFDTYLRVYNGECGALACVTSNDDGGNSCIDISNADFFDSYVTFEAEAGVTYLIRVGGFSSYSGNYELQVDCVSSEAAGCTDPTAINFNDGATVDDGSCVYVDEEGSGNAGYAVDFETIALEFKLFPVPASGEINLQVNKLTQPGRLRVAIYSTEGRLIRSESYTHSESFMRVSMNVSDLATGYYFVESTGYWGNQVIPFVKE